MTQLLWKTFAVVGCRLKWNLKHTVLYSINVLWLTFDLQSDPSGLWSCTSPVHAVVRRVHSTGSVGGVYWDSCSATLPIVRFRWHHLSGRSWKDCHHASQRGRSKGLTIYFLYITLTYTLLLLLTIQPPCFLTAAWESEAAASITGRRGASCRTHPSLLFISRGRMGRHLAVWPETQRSQGQTQQQNKSL